MPAPCEACKETCSGGGAAACGERCSCGPNCACGPGKTCGQKKPTSAGAAGGD